MSNSDFLKIMERLDLKTNHVKSSSSQERKIVVGIDFGTTFSGVAWGNTYDAHINIIQQWPGLSSPRDKSSEKVPTQVLYDEEASWGFRWGYQIRDDLPRHQWFKINLNDIHSYLSIKKGKLILTSSDVKEILEPVIAQVVNLVREQIRTTSREVKAVLLVGGFGMSMYLRERIKEAVDKKIEVLQPAYGWSAVVRGAVMKGLAQSEPKHAKVRLTSCIARKHLGTSSNLIFDEKIHLASRKWFDKYDGKWRTTAMDWFIKKGDTVNEDKPYKFHYYQASLADDGRLKEVTTIIYCDRTSRSAVIYHDKEVVELARLKVKIEDLPNDAFDLEVGKDGELYYVIHYTVEVTYQSASTKYELVHKGKRYNSVTAEYV